MANDMSKKAKYCKISLVCGNLKKASPRNRKLVTWGCEVAEIERSAKDISYTIQSDSRESTMYSMVILVRNTVFIIFGNCYGSRRKGNGNCGT